MHNNRDGMGSAAGKRLRTDGTKKNEEECRQMLRLAEVENKELKNSLRYIEIQLAKCKYLPITFKFWIIISLSKSRENYKQLTQKYEDAQEQMQSATEQIARQSNINHAQAQQIEEMGKKLENVAAD